MKTKVKSNKQTAKSGNSVWRLRRWGLPVLFAFCFLFCALVASAQTNAVAALGNASDVRIANDVAQLVYDVLGKFNLTGLLSTLGGGGFLCYWVLKFLTNKFPGFGSSAVGQFITLVIRAEAKQLTPSAGATVPPRLQGTELK